MFTNKHSIGPFVVSAFQSQGKKNEVTQSCLTVTRLLCPWDFPGKSTGVGCHFLLQSIFPTQGLNPGLPHCRQMLYCLSHQESLAKVIFTQRNIIKLHASV